MSISAKLYLLKPCSPRCAVGPRPPSSKLVPAENLDTDSRSSCVEPADEGDSGAFFHVNKCGWKKPPPTQTRNQRSETTTQRPRVLGLPARLRPSAAPVPPRPSSRAHADSMRASKGDRRIPSGSSPLSPTSVRESRPEIGLVRRRMSHNCAAVAVVDTMLRSGGKAQAADGKGRKVAMGGRRNSAVTGRLSRDKKKAAEGLRGRRRSSLT